VRSAERNGALLSAGAEERAADPRPAAARPISRFRSVGARRWIRASSVLGMASACSGLPFAARPIPDCPAEIRSTDEIPGDFSSRQWITVAAEDVNFPFELVAQKKGRELVLIGLSPVGAKLFSVIQVGVETRVDALPGAALPVPPLNVLRDLHRYGLPPSHSPADARRRVVFDHADCGYSIAIETLGEGALP